MVKFPETAAREWRAVADTVQAKVDLQSRIYRDTKIEVEVERLRVRHAASLLFQNELDAEFTPSLELISLSDYKSGLVAAPDDLISGVVKTDAMTLMLGPSGSGKSTLGLQMLYSLITGEPWLGQAATKIDGAVGVLSYDMPGAMMMDWMDGFPNIDPARVSAVNAHKRGNPLAVPAMRSQIATHWKAMGVEVVLLDSFSASFFAQDQNDAGATMAHYRDLKMFALTEVGAKALIVIVHSTDSNPHKARGSSTHHDVADSIAGMSVDHATGSRTVRMVKYRQHRDGATGQMTNGMSPVVIGAPDVNTHLVDLDLGGMTLAGFSLPPGSTAVFDPLPAAHEEPDTDDSGEDDDL